MRNTNKKNWIQEQIQLTLLLIGIIVFACSLPAGETNPQGTVTVPYDEVEVTYVLEK